MKVLQPATKKALQRVFDQCLRGETPDAALPARQMTDGFRGFSQGHVQVLGQVTESSNGKGIPRRYQRQIRLQEHC